MQVTIILILDKSADYFLDQSFCRMSVNSEKFKMQIILNRKIYKLKAVQFTMIYGIQSSQEAGTRECLAFFLKLTDAMN